MDPCVVWQHQEAGLYARIRGHTSDMGLQVFREESTPIPEEPILQWSLAQALSQRYRAKLIVWFDPEALDRGRAVLRIALGNPHRRIERDLGAIERDERDAIPSALLEMAANIARESLLALAEDELVTETLPEDQIAAPAHSLVERTAPTAESRTSIRVFGSVRLPPPPARPATRHHMSPNWSLGLGPSMVLDGLSRRVPAFGAFVRVDRSFEFFNLGAVLGAEYPVTNDSTYGVFRLVAGRFAASGSVNLRTSSVETWMGLQLGMQMYERYDSRSSETTDHVRATHLIPFVGPEMRSRIRLSAERFWSEVAIGLLVPTTRLDIGYEVAGNFQSVGKVWPVQPFFQLGLAAVP